MLWHLIGYIFTAHVLLAGEVLKLGTIESAPIATEG